MSLAQFLFIAGAVPFFYLGLIHIVFTALDATNPQRIVPRDADLIARMQAGSLRITDETSVWRAWIGFNFSHGLGAFFFGFIYLALALGHFITLQTSPPLLVAAPVIALVYVVLSVKYWFRIPAIGTGLGFALLFFGAILA